MSEVILPKVDPITQEDEFVHTVYNEIASHFSQTRYKPWPIVVSFLESREKFSIGIDVGCGNGKYLGVNKDLYILGSDRSSGLISCANDFGHEVMVADGLHLPHSSNFFDFGISIAVIHHFATEERRIGAIRHILSKIKSGGELLVYCWALEQESSRRGYKEGMDQDVLVPWVLQQKKHKKVKEQKKQFSKKSQKSKSNVEHNDKADPFTSDQQTSQVDDSISTTENTETDIEKETGNEAEKEPDTKYRYYHLYKKGELIENAEKAGGIVVENGYERDNWWVVIRKP